MKIEDKDIERLVRGSKLKASDYLADRILHQIRAEDAVTPNRKVEKPINAQSTLTIFGVIYLIIGLVGGMIYLKTGTFEFTSTKFLIPAILIFAVGAIFWGITLFDDLKNSKKGIE